MQHRPETTGSAPHEASVPFVPPSLFPDAVSSKYIDKLPGKARLMTCLDQFRENAARGLNATLRWIDRNGGYYRACDENLRPR